MNLGEVDREAPVCKMVGGTCAGMSVMGQPPVEKLATSFNLVCFQ